ncbi:hypothetical protein NE857_02085 [Nocardiopsis exhalans]|uniref:Uncharacterized protein n=1 Tax=Nocardiopsis exhalans TaxID=163604 RepID=A0ABY5DBJ0_9ACTN|nr:hypothetical protein [Nocardiopsis exhalans]USY20472.1 hypothetical protein NE857_02085 [Nocardiopsis exhalans]
MTPVRNTGHAHPLPGALALALVAALPWWQWAVDTGRALGTSPPGLDGTAEGTAGFPASVTWVHSS